MPVLFGSPVMQKKVIAFPQQATSFKVHFMSTAQTALEKLFSKFYTWGFWKVPKIMQ